MAARVEEAYSERTEKVNASGEIVEIEIHYLVFEAADEDAALAAARTKAKAKTVTGMSLESVEVEERVNSTTWRVKAEYASTGSSGGDEGGDDEDAFSTSFDTGGGTMHLNQSLGTSAKAPNDAPDFGGAIGVDGEGNVAGVDVTMPVFNFEETHTLSGTVVTNDWKKKVAALTGTINKAAFRGFAAGEVLFLGAAGSKRSKKASANWEITFRFAVSANQAQLKIGDLTIANKRGWDYLWVSYKTTVAANGKSLVKKPAAAYVEKVYPDGDFGTLGI